MTANTVTSAQLVVFDPTNAAGHALAAQLSGLAMQVVVVSEIERVIELAPSSRMLLLPAEMPGLPLNQVIEPFLTLNPRARVVVYAESSSDTLRTIARNAGADYVLIQPISTLVLQSMVRTLLYRARPMIEAPAPVAVEVPAEPLVVAAEPMAFEVPQLEPAPTVAAAAMELEPAPMAFEVPQLAPTPIEPVPDVVEPDFTVDDHQDAETEPDPQLSALEVPQLAPELFSTPPAALTPVEIEPVEAEWVQPEPDLADAGWVEWAEPAAFEVPQLAPELATVNPPVPLPRAELVLPTWEPEPAVAELAPALEPVLISAPATPPHAWIQYDGFEIDPADPLGLGAVPIDPTVALHCEPPGLAEFLAHRS